MRTLTPIFTLLLLSCGPCGQTPGIRLGGTERPTPASFEFLDDHPELQLEAQGQLLPRVVNLWGVAFDGAIYVAGTPDRGWVQRVEQRPEEVRVRIGGDTYALRASTVLDRAVQQKVFIRFQEKYGVEAVDASVGGNASVDDFEVIFRLAPRT